MHNDYIKTNKTYYHQPQKYCHTFQYPFHKCCHSFHSEINLEKKQFTLILRVNLTKKTPPRQPIRA
jgi:hypothetical protein